MSRSSCRSNGRYLSTTIPEFWSRIQLVLCSDLDNQRHSHKTGMIDEDVLFIGSFRRFKTSPPNPNDGVYEKIKCG